MKFPILILFLFTLSLFGTEPCEKISDLSKKAACYQNLYIAVDKTLNEVYSSLRSKIKKNEFAEMKKNSKEWIAYKENYCGMQETLSENENEKSIHKYSCLVTMTEERTLFLKLAFGKDGVSPGISGSYSDSFGGMIELKSTPKDFYFFKIIVVRGFSAHTGELDGSIAIKNDNARYVLKSDSGELECDLKFKFLKSKIEIDELKCDLYHGANAYFSGTYFKIK